jgi:carbonic anhydrase
MCGDCERAAFGSSVALSRRRVLQGLGGTAAALAVSAGAQAAPPQNPPKPENVISPEAALDRLLKGNQRYVEGVTRRHDFRNEREALSRAQNPFAAILGCADSRVAPEYAFDSGRGDLFVCRVAGNVANDDAVASLEYAVSSLKTPLIMVLGHEACGAVEAAIHSAQSGSTPPGHLPSLVASLAPAVKAGLAEPGDTLKNAVRQNVTLTAQRVMQAAPILSKLAENKQIRVIGAIYRLSDGKVEVLN